MLKRFTLIVLVLVVGYSFSTAYAEDNFIIKISPELQERLDFVESRVEHPDSNFGYRTVHLTVQPKQPGDRPMIWARFYDADDELLETVWDRIKSDERQKCKFNYMDVKSNAVRATLSIANQQ